MLDLYIVGRGYFPSEISFIFEFVENASTTVSVIDVLLLVRLLAHTCQDKRLLCPQRFQCCQKTITRPRLRRLQQKHNTK